MTPPELDSDDAGRVQAAYGAATFQRLRAIKERYDPGNFFRVNQNIGPASGVSGSGPS